MEDHIYDETDHAYEDLLRRHDLLYAEVQRLRMICFVPADIRYSSTPESFDALAKHMREMSIEYPELTTKVPEK